MTSYFRTAVLAILVSFPAFASITFRGDFETGDLMQWTSVEAANPDHLLVVPSPVAQGRFALQVTVAPGEIIYNGNRNELDYENNPNEGDERWYQFDTLFPDDFQSANTWQAFCQFHQYVAGGSPPVWFQVVGEQLRFGTSSYKGVDTVLWTAPLVRGVWHQFTLHVRWSSDKTAGFLELYYDGALAMPQTSAATLFPNDTVYLKEGLYRDSSIGFTQTLYEDGMIEATSASDLQIVPPAPDAGTPPDDAGTPPDDSGTPPDDAGTGTPPDDSGTPPPEDAGTPVVDAGTPVIDAGTPPTVDAGTPDGGGTPVVTDAGTQVTRDGGTVGVDPLTPGAPGDPMSGVGGCGVAGSGGAMTLLLLLGWLFGVLKRRRLATP